MTISRGVAFARRVALLFASLAVMPSLASAACVILNGGGPSTWTVCDTFATTNGLPTGGGASEGNGATITDASLSAQSDAFDQAGNVWLNNVVLGGTLVQSGNGVDFAIQSNAGLQTQVSYDVLTTDAVLRVYARFTNPGTGTINATVTYTNNFGSDGGTRIGATASGDVGVSSADRWVVSSDSSDSDAVNTTVLFSGAAPVQPSLVTTTAYNNFGTEGVLATYPISVPANSTIALVWFQRLSPTTPIAAAAAPQFDNIGPTSPLLAGLTPPEVSAIRNIGTAVSGTPLAVTSINGSTVTPISMAQSLLSGSSGIQIISASYTGANGASGTFSGGTGIVGFPNGIILTSGSVNVAPGPNGSSGFSTGNGLPGDTQLDALVGGNTFDASTLQITFVPGPGANEVRFSYVLGSEEYNEFVGDEFNDVFAFFVNGTNYALVPGTSTPVTINNVNCGTDGASAGVNCALFINNAVGLNARNTELDGLTIVLGIAAPVNPGVPNTLRLSIADRSDAFLDSAVFIAGGSLTAVTPPQLASAVSLAVTPSRITQSGPVVVNWTPVNATGCVLSGGAPGTVFPTPQNNQVTLQVNASTVRNDLFRVACNSQSGQVSGNAVLSVGVPAPPPSVPVTLLSAGVGGAAANSGSRNIDLSDGGRFVAFESTASNLVAGDTNGTSDVFMRNTATGAVTRVSTGTGGSQLNAVSADAKITRNGALVYYTRGTGITTLADGAKTVANGQICFTNLGDGNRNCISKGLGGNCGFNGCSNTEGNGASNRPSLSADGGVVVYESLATNLSSQDGNGATSDIFKYTAATNKTEILSLSNANAAATAASNAPSVSCNGRNVVFESLGSLVNGAPLSPGVRNIYITTGASPAKQLVSVGIGGSAANGNSFRPRVSDDGRFVFYESSASNLVANDTNNVNDIFVRDVVAGTTTRVSRASVAGFGLQANGASREPQIPCDGAYVTFESEATNLVSGDSNGRADVFLVNMGTGSVALASQNNGSAPNGTSGNGELSPDGTAVGFESDAPALGGNPAGSVYAGGNPFAVQNYTGAWFDPTQAGHGLFLDQLPDGRLVAWWFTFDPSGAQAWFGGVGQVQGTTAVVSVTRTRGTRFIPNFNTAETTNTPIGTLSFNFTSCSTGRVDFALDSTFSTGFMNLTRLTTPLGVSCGGTSSPAPKALYVAKPGYVADDFFVAQSMKAVEPTVGPIAGVTGAWYDPAQAGHGLFMENLGDGRVLAWWFTFGPNGGQAWFGGIAEITSPTTAQINFLKTQGGRWIPNFNPANVTNPVLGPATLTFPNCDSGTLTYSLNQGFGNNQMILRPLLRPVGTSCSG